jgi:antitoxin VapB
LPGASKTATESSLPAKAKLFSNGRSQAVRLPKEFRMPGKEVAIRRSGEDVILSPIGKKFDFDAWNRALDKYRHIPFMPEGREQPAMPEDDFSFDR